MLFRGLIKRGNTSAIAGQSLLTFGVFFHFIFLMLGVFFFILRKWFRFCSDLLQMSSDAGMNLFKEILPRVRKIFSNATVSDDHALLNLMLKEDMISKEYHQALLHEKDRGDLARKIPLTFVEKWDLYLNTLIPLCSLNLCGSKPQNMTDNESSGSKYISGKSALFFFFALLKIYFHLLHFEIAFWHIAKYISGEQVGKRREQNVMQEQLKRDPPIQGSYRIPIFIARP